MPNVDYSNKGEPLLSENAEERRERESRAAASKTFKAPKATAKDPDEPDSKNYPNDLAGYSKAMREYREGKQSKDPTRAAISNMVKENAKPAPKATGGGGGPKK